VSGKVPAFKVWESETHLAFLSIFPNMEGVTVVIPKKHISSYLFSVAEDDMLEIVKAAKEVALILDAKLDAERTAMVFEGLGVNHLHAKLYPLCGIPKSGEFVSMDIKSSEYFERYPGFITTNDCNKVTKEQLAQTCKKIVSK
jgi:diadenosine tetraphosphate (Ap4A) HIT family hydrolase